MTHSLFNDKYIQLNEWFSENTPPLILCGACQDGYLSIDKSSYIENTASLEMHEHPDWDPEWITGLSMLILKCGNPKCKSIAVGTGNYRLEFDVEYDNETREPMQTYSKEIKITSIFPASPIILKNNEFPNTIIPFIDEASLIGTVSPGAAANRIRTAIDELLDNQKIVKHKTSQKGTRRKLSTHERIGIFALKNKEVADILLAVKWIGNNGTHGNLITLSEVLDGAELFSHALESLYDKRKASLSKMAKKINNRKGK